MIRLACATVASVLLVALSYGILWLILVELPVSLRAV